MKEVGIMTWFTYNNYGTVLQAYALSKKLENMQVIPEIINYRPKIRKTNIYDMKIKFILKTQISHIQSFCKVAYCLLCQRILSILQPQHSDFCKQRTIVIALPHFRFW